MPPLAPEVTDLLLARSQGESSALNKLMPRVHDELQRLAHRYMAGERGGRTLQTTALVNEPICAWWTAGACAGRTAHTFLQFLRN
jgi:hypothetical protein